MAGQPGSTASALPAAAHVVGNAFVNQYYNVLHQSPQVVHRFYTDASRLTRAEAGADGSVDTVVSQSEIHQKVMALDYGDFKAEINTVDSQDSLTGGVLVMVTGSLYKKLSGKKNFVQSFFLAPQEKGYFVLNDIFRFVEEDASQTSRQAPVLANGIPVAPHVDIVAEPEPFLRTEHEAREMSPPSIPEAEPMVEEIFESEEQVDVSEAEDENVIEDSSHAEATPVIDEPPSPMAAPSVPVLSREETSEEAPKKSYASILRMKENAGSPVLSTIYTIAPKLKGPAADQVAPYTLRPAIATTGQDSLDESSLIENEGAPFAIDGRSVYVKNLPMSISSSQLEEEFGKFGLIKPGGVNVKSQKQGVCYAFVEFEETASAQTAIELSPIAISGRQVYIEEKRPVALRAGGRGGRLPGMGRSDRSLRSDGLRGRSSLAGRGLGGRGPGQDRDRDIQLKGRGTGPVRSSSGSFGVGSNNNVAHGGVVGTNGSGIDQNRRDATGGNGNRASRRGGGNQASRNGAFSRGNPPVAAM